MTRQKGTVHRVVDVAAHPRTLVDTQVCAHSVQVVTITVTGEVVSNGAPALRELFSRLRQASVWEAKVISGIAIEDSTQPASDIVEDGGEGDVEVSLAVVVDTNQTTGLHHRSIAWRSVDHYRLQWMYIWKCHWFTIHLEHKGVSNQTFSYESITKTVLKSTNLYCFQVRPSHLSLHVSHCNYHRSFPRRAFVHQPSAYLHLHH